MQQSFRSMVEIESSNEVLSTIASTLNCGRNHCRYIGEYVVMEECPRANLWNCPNVFSKSLQSHVRWVDCADRKPMPFG